MTKGYSLLQTWPQVRQLMIDDLKNKLAGGSLSPIGIEHALGLIADLEKAQS